MNLTAILATLLAAAVAFGAWQYVRANGLADDLDTCTATLEARKDAQDAIDRIPIDDDALADWLRGIGAR